VQWDELRTANADGIRKELCMDGYEWELNTTAFLSHCGA
jgi:hypothetical protein